MIVPSRSRKAAGRPPGRVDREANARGPPALTSASGSPPRPSSLTAALQPSLILTLPNPSGRPGRSTLATSAPPGSGSISPGEGIGWKTNFRGRRGPLTSPDRGRASTAVGTADDCLGPDLEPGAPGVVGR